MMIRKDEPMIPSNHRVEGAGRSSSLKPQASSLIGCCLFLLATPVFGATPILTDFSLTHSYTCGPRYFRLHGADVESGATIKLVQAGQPDILATDIANYIAAGDPDAHYVTGRFDLSNGTAGGFWSVTAINPGGESATITDVLEVVPDCPRGAAGDLYVCNSKMNNILQYDGLTRKFVCIFTGATTWDDTWVTELKRPERLAWAPNGELLVTSLPPGSPGGVVIRYDGSTGDFLGYVLPPPADANRLPRGLTFGGPEGNLYLQSAGGANDVISKQYSFDRASSTWVFVSDTPGLVMTPPMVKPYEARWASNGNLLVIGDTLGSPVPTLREYEYNAGSGSYEVIAEVVDLGEKFGIVESPDGLFYDVVESNWHRVDRYSANPLVLVDTLIPVAACMALPADPPPCAFEAMRSPFDLVYTPEGHLLVTARETVVPDPTPGPGYFMAGAIHQFDPASGDQLSIIGKLDFWDGKPPDVARLWRPFGMVFKPMPGDYTSARGTFSGDWVVDLADCAKLAANMLGPGLRPTNPHALLSFDQDRDGDLDLKDYAAFQQLFGSSMQTNVGACCNPDVTCSDDVWAPACGGFYLGDATTCGVGVCPAFGACCDGQADGTCQDLTESQCLTLGDTYQGDFTTCGLIDCPFGRYSNEIDPMTSVALAGAGLQIADDLTLAGTGARDLVYLDLRVYGNGGGAFDVTVELWTDCPGNGGSVIPNTTFDWIGVPDDGFVYTLVVDPLSPAVTIPDTVWMVASFSTPESGWIIAEQAETGTTADVYGWNNPWTCNNTFGANYAGLWANLRCVEGSSKRSSGDNDATRLDMFRVDDAPAELGVQSSE